LLLLWGTRSHTLATHPVRSLAVCTGQVTWLADEEDRARFCKSAVQVGTSEDHIIHNDYRNRMTTMLKRNHRSPAATRAILRYAPHGGRPQVYAAWRAGYCGPSLMPCRCLDDVVEFGGVVDAPYPGGFQGAPPLLDKSCRWGLLQGPAQHVGSPGAGLTAYRRVGSDSDTIPKRTFVS